MIDAEKANHSVSRMVQLLEVSRSGYYAWAARQGAQPGPRAARRADLTVKIKVAHNAFDGVNGAPRILADLREAGEVVSVKTVAKLMRQNNIRGISPRPWHPVTTIADATAHTIPDLVARRFDRGALNVVWTSDITYLATGEGWLYLCAVRDGCSRRVLGYAFADSLHTDVVESALRRAVTFRGAHAGIGAEGVPFCDPPGLFDPECMAGGVLAWMTDDGRFDCPLDPERVLAPLSDDELLRLRAHSHGLADDSSGGT